MFLKIDSFLSKHAGIFITSKDMLMLFQSHADISIILKNRLVYFQDRLFFYSQEMQVFCFVFHCMLMTFPRHAFSYFPTLVLFILEDRCIFLFKTWWYFIPHDMVVFCSSRHSGASLFSKVWWYSFYFAREAVKFFHYMPATCVDGENNNISSLFFSLRN